MRLPAGIYPRRERPETNPREVGHSGKRTPTARTRIWGVNRQSWDAEIRHIGLPRTGKLDFTQKLKEATDAITLGRRHLWLASEGFSLSAANADVQELPATLYHLVATSLVYAA